MTYVPYDMHTMYNPSWDIYTKAGPLQFSEAKVKWLGHLIGSILWACLPLGKWNAGFRLRGDYWKMTFEKGLRWWSERRPKLVCHWSCFWWCKGVVFGRLQNGYQGASREMSGWQIQTLVETPNGDTPLGTNISLPQQRLKMIFLFPRRRDMLVSWRVHQVL